MLMRKLGRTGLKSRRPLPRRQHVRLDDGPEDVRGGPRRLHARPAATSSTPPTSTRAGRPATRAASRRSALGKWMTARGNRSAVLIATKVMGPMGPGPNDTGLSRHHIVEGVEASLRRLQTDYIDLYQAHWDDRETPLDETLRAFDDLVRQGKVRYIGASNYHAWRLTRALWESDRRGYARYESLQPKYNLVFRDEYERELEPLCLEQDVGVIPYSSLGERLPLGQVPPRRAICPTTARAGGVQKGYMNDRGFARARGGRQGRGGGRRHAGAGRAVLARPPARDHRADRERHLRGAAPRADRRRSSSAWTRRRPPRSTRRAPGARASHPARRGPMSCR